MAVHRTLICLAATTLLMQLAMAANYTVGGPNGGWDANTDLQTWATSQSFSVGDNLVFQYSPSHDVREVSKADYDSCQAGNAAQVYTGGNTIITLSSPGKKYYICGTPGHCSGGMKVEIDTLATSSPPPASPSTPPTSSPTTPPPQASPTTPTPAASPVSPPVSSPEISSPSPAQSPKTAPKMSPTTSPSSSPSSSPPPPNVPSTESPTTAPPPGSSSATKGVSKTTVTMGFSLGMLMLLAL